MKNTAILEAVTPELHVSYALAMRVVQAAEQFCEELQEDAEGMPALQLSELHSALDACDGKLDYLVDDANPAQAALAMLAADPHATDSQRRTAILALSVLEDWADEQDREYRRWQDGIRDRLIAMNVPHHLIDGAGCDSGDPLDFTLTEVGQGVGYYLDKFEALKQELETMRTTIAAAIREDAE